MAKYAVIGSGYLASALKEKIKSMGETVDFYPTEDTETIFYFGGVVHMDFNKNVRWHSFMTANEFAAIVAYCKDTGTRLVYASSALVYEPKTDFSMCKLDMEHKAMEELPDSSLGLRIFPVYGKEKNRTNKTAIAKFCEAEVIEMYGKGEQTRSFIHVDDVMHYIMDMEKCQTIGIADIGYANPVSFKEIVRIITLLKGSTVVKHYEAPQGYQMSGVVPEHPLPVITSLEDGIRKELLES